jgi:hypothetical protein
LFGPFLPLAPSLSTPLPSLPGRICSSLFSNFVVRPLIKRKKLNQRVKSIMWFNLYKSIYICMLTFKNRERQQWNTPNMTVIAFVGQKDHGWRMTISVSYMTVLFIFGETIQICFFLKYQPTNYLFMILARG